VSRPDSAAPYTMLLPPGWTRVAVDDATDGVFSSLIEDVVGRAPSARRGALRDMLTTAVRSALASARSRRAIDLVLSFAEVEGLPLPASIITFPLEPPEDGRSAEETLVALARPGSRAVEIDGLPALRRVIDMPGDAGTPAHRAVHYIVHVPWQTRWLLFTASILSSEDPGYGEVREALEALVDAMIATVRFAKSQEAMG